MWLMLALAVVVCVAVLYVPGYLFARSLFVSRFASVAIAPMISIFFLAVLGIVLFEVGVTCSGPVLLAIAVAIGAIALLVSKGIARAKAPNASRELIAIDDVKGAWKAAALYVAVAFAVVFVVFLLAIDGPESFSRNDDTTVHLAIVRGFLDTGTFSTLHASSYLDQGVTSSFYPSAWHVVTAVVASFFGNAVTLAANASIIALTAVVFPLGMCLLFLKLFGEGKRVVWAGSLFVVAFCGFPWGFVVYGQLLSNMVSFMLIPLAFVALVGAIEAKGLSGKVRLAFLVAAGLVSIALSQPNGAFTFGIWAVLYCMGRILVPPCDDAPRIASKRIAAAAALFAVACAGWVVLYFAPFLQNVVQYTWKATLSPLEAIGGGLLFMFTTREGVQPFLSVAVLAGVIYTCRNRRYLWMTVAYAFAFVVYVIDVSTDGVVKQVLSGFWYTDYYRTGAMTALFAIPLASLGFVQLVDIVRSWCAKALRVQADHPKCRYLPMGILVALMLMCQFFPDVYKRQGQDHRRARRPRRLAQRQPAGARDGPSAVHGRAGVHDAAGDGHRGARLQGHELHGPSGRHRDGRHARQGQNREGAQRAHHGSPEQGRDRGGGRVPGHRRQRRHHHARPRRLRHHGGGGGARSGRRRVRDLLRCGRRVHGRPARVPARQEARRCV